MRLTNRYSYRNSLIHFYPADSVNSPYIPIHAVRNGTFVRKGDQKLLLYDLSIETTSRKVGMVSRLISAMTNTGGLPNHFEKHEGFVYYADKGQFINMTDKLKPELLVQLCVKKEYLFDLKSEIVQDHKLALVVSKSLQGHKIGKTVENSYIGLTSSELDIIYTNNIYRLCYNSKVEAPKAATLPEYFQQCNYMNNLLMAAYAK